MVDLNGKKVIITGAAKRIGRQLALACSSAGAAVIIHHNSSEKDAFETAQEITKMGGNAEIIQADFSNPESAVEKITKIFHDDEDLFALVNNASIFKPVKFPETTFQDWQIHLNVNLTMPFLLSQTFAASIGNRTGRIINILDWRAFRPGYDHFPYTITKSALASLTEATAVSLAPNIQVNGIALGAILPPSDGGDENSIIKKVPANRWAKLQELEETFLFLLQGPEYITGEIIHLDGGRHLV